MVKKLKLTVLVDDSMSSIERRLIAKHGLSLLMEGGEDDAKFSILMDTGPSPEITLHNAEVMGVDLGEIDAIFLTHGHYDHTGGVIGILKHIENKKVPVIVHPKIFDVKLKLMPKLKFIGSSFKPPDIEASGGVMLMARNPITIVKGVMTSGEIHRALAYEKVKDFWKIEGGVFKHDIMPDDQALMVSIDGRGLIVLSGCAHAGIVNTIRHAQKVTNVTDVYAVLGGFHLKNADDKRIQLTIKDLLKIDPEVIRPCHCTGSKAIHQLIRAFGDRCKPLRTGDTIEL